MLFRSGRNFAPTPLGTVRNAQGEIAFEPGGLETQYALEAAKAQAQHSQDLVDVYVGPDDPRVQAGLMQPGPYKVPRSMAQGLQPSLTIGANGKPQIALPTGVRTGMDPLQQKEAEGDLAAFQEARKDALAKAEGAPQELQRLQFQAELAKQARLGPGSQAQQAVSQLLGSLGILSKPGQDQLAALREYERSRDADLAANLKKLVPGGRVLTGELHLLQGSMGNIDDPIQAITFMNDARRAAIEQQQEFANFIQNYAGPKGKYLQAWQQTPEGQKGIYDRPYMWKYLPPSHFMVGKPGTPIAGQTVVRTPSGNLYPVTKTPDGEYVPIEE